MTHINIGILAHVDAGKTTLSEAILYRTGMIRKTGRVDSGDAYLDTDAMEKERGITIFSKPAEIVLPGGVPVTLLDTPGHADFSPEMERTLSVMDYAIIVVSALDGVDGRLPVLWRLLSEWHVPTFFFVNKMDRPGMRKEELLSEIVHQFGNGCMDLGGIFREESGTGKTGRDSDTVSPEINLADPDMKLPQGLQEDIAVLDEKLLQSYLEGEHPVTMKDVRRLIRERKLFPVSFGSALKIQGIDEFLRVLSVCAEAPEYKPEFGARVFKIARDGGTRLTWIKVTGGILAAKSVLDIPSGTIPGAGEGTPENAAGEGGARSGDIPAVQEKVNEIRRYSGPKFKLLSEAEAGDIVALTGLTGTKAGMGLGNLAGSGAPQELLQPILSSTILLPDGTDVYNAFRDLRTLEEEEPMLHIVYDAGRKQISAQIMGDVQTEILRRLAHERFGLRIEFGPGRILYRETIRNRAEGVGHFEPLRHYAEVHVMLEPMPAGSGIVFDNVCRTDDLPVNYQKQILSDLESMKFVGVLTGAELTDVKITLLAGKASPKHTEGGDFREAAGRAVRQGLMMAENILLEPMVAYRLTVPSESVGRAMNDMSVRGASCEAAETEDGRTTLTGRVTAEQLGNYAAEVPAYTGGRGSISVSFDGYEPCHNTEEVIEKSGYIAELDTEHPASSVFCSHGVGTIIPWDEVRSYMHIDTGWRPEGESAGGAEGSSAGHGSDGSDLDADADGYNAERAYHARKAGIDPETLSFEERESARTALDNELKDIFEKTYGAVKKHRSDEEAQVYGAGKEKQRNTPDGGSTGYGKTSSGNPHRRRQEEGEEFLLVDGYNIIWAWPELRALAQGDIKAARDRLTDILMNYGGYVRAHVILVFDAYKVRGGTGEVNHLPNLDVIYTKEAETADLYIEKAAHELAKKSRRVTVATSDAVEQVIICGAGAARMSADGFLEEVKRTEQEIRERIIR